MGALTGTVYPYVRVLTIFACVCYLGIRGETTETPLKGFQHATAEFRVGQTGKV